MPAAAVRNVTRTWLSILHKVLLVGLMERPGVPAVAKEQILPARVICQLSIQQNSLTARKSKSKYVTSG